MFVESTCLGVYRNDEQHRKSQRVSLLCTGKYYIERNTYSGIRYHTRYHTRISVIKKLFYILVLDILYISRGINNKPDSKSDEALC